MIWISLLLCWSSGLLANATPAESSVALTFYSEQLNLAYNSDMLAARCARVEDKAITAYYHQLEKTNYRTLLDDLLQQQKHLQLNDWLFFQLLHSGVQKIAAQKSALERELICWFLLSQAGFDTRLTYLTNRVFVYVYSPDEIFEVPIIEENGRNYVNLTSIQKSDRPETLYLLNFIPRPNGKAFRLP